MTPEANIESQFVRAVSRRYAWPCLKLRIDGQNGFPDRTVLTPRGPWFVEFKRPGGQLSAQQKRWRRRLESLGYPFELTYSADDAVQALHAWYSGD